MSQKYHNKSERMFLQGSYVRTKTFEEGVKLGKSSQLVQWPYAIPSAESMSKAGFYFTPTKRLTDRITCFYCNSKQTKWKNITDPTAFHLKAHPNCLFSKLESYKSQYATNPDFSWGQADVFKDPFSDEAINFRIQSFGENWPFDDIKGAIPTSSKMVEAGFSYWPQEEGDDLAICHYCNVSLEGWETHDDPLYEHEKRATSKCYYLNKLDERNKELSSSKRSSDNLEATANKKQRISISKFSDKSSDTTPSTAIQSQRTLRKSKSKRYNISSSDHDSYSISRSENDVSFNDDSFASLANSIDISSEQEFSASKQPAKRLGHTKKTKIQSKSSQSNKDIKSSPKKEILDSSFESNGIFSNRNLKDLDLDVALASPGKILQQPSSKDPKTSMKINSNKPALQDITNLTDTLDQNFHKVSKRGNKILKASEIPKPQDTTHHNEEEDDEVILVSQSKDDSRVFTSKITQATEESVSILQPKPKTVPIFGPASPIENIHNGSLLNLRSNVVHKEVKDLNASYHDSIGNLTQGPNEKSITDIRITNKSILSQSRFLTSDVIQRSRSPFLDHDYKGVDDIEKEQFLDPDDIPLEESTDHNIQAPIQTILPRTLKNIPNLSRSSKQLHDSGSYSDMSFHSAEEDDNSKSNSNQTWVPTDTNKLFQAFEDLEVAKNYLSELKELPYELNDDIDGRVSCFINEMPDDELNMSIEEWIIHSAKQGRSHLEVICQKMISQFDAESDRALEKLRNLKVD